MTSPYDDELDEEEYYEEQERRRDWLADEIAADIAFEKAVQELPEEPQDDDG